MSRIRPYRLTLIGTSPRGTLITAFEVCARSRDKAARLAQLLFAANHPQLSWRAFADR